MLIRAFLVWLFAASAALAQSYPSPVVNNTTVNGNFYTPSKTGYFYGNSASAASFATTIPTSVLTGTFPGTSIPFTQAGTGAITSDVNTKLLSLSLSPVDYGAKGDTHGNVDATITSGTTAFTSPLTTFSNADVGKIIRIAGAGPAGATFETYISAFVSTHAVTLASPVNTSVAPIVGPPFVPSTFYYGTDDAIPWQHAVDQCQGTSGKIEPGPGYWTISSALSVTNTCSISGVGGNSTVIMPSNTGNGITVNTAGVIVFEKIGITYVGFANTGTSAISITGPYSVVLPYTYGNSQAVIRDVVMNSADTCVKTIAAYAWNIDNLKCFAYGAVGVVVREAGGTHDAGDSKLTNSYLSSRNTSSVACIQMFSSGGMHITNNTCNGPWPNAGSYGLLFQLESGASTGQLFIAHNTFDGTCNVACISFSRQAASGSFGRIIIANNGMNLAHFGVSVNSDANGVWIESMQILGNYWYDDGSASNYAFYIDSVRELIIAHNSGMATVNTDTLIAVLSAGAGPGVTNAIVGPNMKGNVGTGTQTWVANSIGGTNVTTIAPN